MDRGTYTSEQSTTSPGRQPNGAPTDAFKNAATHLAEFKSFLGSYVSAKADAAKVSMRRLLIAVALGIVGGIVGIAFLIVAASMLLNGLANAIGAIFEPDKPWVGQLIVGALVLGGAVAGTILAVRKMTGASRKKTVAKYESQHAEQRRRFGHDVRDAAAGQSATTS